MNGIKCIKKEFKNVYVEIKMSYSIYIYTA